MYKNNVEIVVARYNENLEWLNEYPFNQFEYIVYNKGDNDKFVKKNVKQIIQLSNVGMCDHTYLYHIIQNYENLSNTIVFLPGSVNISYKKQKAINLLTRIIKSNYTCSFFIGNYHNSVKQYYKNFYLDEHKCAYDKNHIKNNITKLQPCKIRPYENWYNYFFGDSPAHYATHCGIFSIDKRDIIQHPIYRYKLLIETVNKTSHHESAHYMERSWGAIFYPMINTIKVIE